VLRSFWYTFALALALVYGVIQHERAYTRDVLTQALQTEIAITKMERSLERQADKQVVAAAVYDNRLMAQYVTELQERVVKLARRNDCISTSYNEGED
jgi:hypothetical protein